MMAKLDEQIKGAKMTRDEALSLFEDIRDFLVDRGLDPGMIRYGGSLRRGKSVIADLDIALLEPEKVDKHLYLELVAYFQKAGYNVVAKRVGDAMASILIDDRLVELEKAKLNHAAFMLYKTGSGQFNTQLRAYAKEKGYTLSRNGLFGPDGRLIDTPTEEDIFNALGVPYVEPEDRDIFRPPAPLTEPEIPAEIWQKIPDPVKAQLEHFKLPERDAQGRYIPADFMWNRQARHRYYRIGGTYRLPDAFKLDRYLDAGIAEKVTEYLSLLKSYP